MLLLRAVRVRRLALTRLAAAWGSQNNFVAFKEKLYFAARDDTHGMEMWVSDGTKKGTKLFKDIKPGTSTKEGSPVCMRARATDVLIVCL